MRNYSLWRTILLLIVLAVMAPPLMAQVTGAPPAAAALPGAQDATSMTMMQILKAGGWLMYVLGAMSVLALAFIIYLAVMLRPNAVCPRELLHDLRDMLAARKHDEARQACRRSGSALASVTETALTYLQRADRPDFTLLKEFMEGEGSRQAAQLNNQATYLLDIAVIAPMVGLLGTVTGMLQAFNAVALDLARAKPMLLANGVAQALVTTIAGLLVGIPAMACYAYFRNRVSKLTALLETAAADLLTYFMPGGRL